MFQGHQNVIKLGNEGARKQSLHLYLTCMKFFTNKRMSTVSFFQVLFQNTGNVMIRVFDELCV